MAFTVVTLEAQTYLVGTKAVYIVPKAATVSAASTDGTVEVRKVSYASGGIGNVNVEIYRDDQSGNANGSGGSRDGYLYESGIKTNAV